MSNDFTIRPNPDTFKSIHRYSLPGPHDLEVWENTRGRGTLFVLVLDTGVNNEHTAIQDSHAARLLREALGSDEGDDDD